MRISDETLLLLASLGDIEAEEVFMFCCNCDIHFLSSVDGFVAFQND